MKKSILKFFGLGLISLVFTLDTLHANPFDDLLVPVSAGKKITKSKSNPLYAGTEFASNNGARNISDVGKSANSDTVKIDNKIEKFYNDGDILKVKVKIANPNDNITISAYNMLGRKILDVYSGAPRKDEIYDIYAQNLQNGMYICIVQGSDFKLVEKFVVSR